MLGMPELLPDLRFASMASEKKHAKELDSQMQAVQKVVNDSKSSLKELSGAVMTGFNIAVSKGPLMDEPMQGTIFILEEISSLVAGDEEPEDNAGM